MDSKHIKIINSPEIIYQNPFYVPVFPLYFSTCCKNPRFNMLRYILSVCLNKIMPIFKLVFNFIWTVEIQDSYQATAGIHHYNDS